MSPLIFNLTLILTMEIPILPAIWRQEVFSCRHSNYHISDSLRLSRVIELTITYNRIQILTVRDTNFN